METGLTKPQKTLVISSAFIAGTAYYLLDFNIYLLATFLILLFFLGFKKLASPLLLILCIAVFGTSILYADYRMPKPDALYRKAPAKLELTGRVVSEPRTDLKNKTKFYFQSGKSKTLVTIYDYKRKFESIRIGDIIKIKGSVKRPYKATNWGQFDYGKYLRNNGIFTLTHVGYKNWEIIKPSGSLDIRNKIMDIHAKNLKSPKLEVLGGMVFGDYAVPAPQEIEDEFIKSGLLHLLAASGMNVGIIFGIWYFFASKVRLSFRITIIVGMLLVALYSLMTGLPPSVTRAALMLEFLLIGKLFDRKADNATLLVMVCVLMLLFNPFMLANVGFQLSFIVTLGLLIAVPVFIEKLKPVPEYLSGALIIPIVAQLFASPIQIFHFNNFVVYSVLANIAVMPFVGIISFAGFLGSVFALIPVIGEKICFIADKIAEPFIFLLLAVSKFTSELPGALQYPSTPQVPAVIAFYIMLILLVFARKQAIIAFLVIIFFLFKGNFNNNLEFVFFDVGEGDSILISTPDNRHILVDTGPPGWYCPAKTAVTPYLKDKGISSLDALVLTHPDSDHIGGTIDILKTTKPHTIYHNGVENKTKTYRSIENYIEQNHLRTVILTDNDTVFSGNDLTITAIRPDHIDDHSNNEDSIMLYIVYKDFSALLMADCEADSLDKIDDTVKNPVTLLKVGHHGSEDAISEEFLQYINPEISVISVGRKGYQWGHPDFETISLLREFKSQIFRTDKDYAIKVVTDGHKTNIIKFGDK